MYFCILEASSQKSSRRNNKGFTLVAHVLLYIGVVNESLVEEIIKDLLW